MGMLDTVSTHMEVSNLWKSFFSFHCAGSGMELTSPRLGDGPAGHLVAVKG